jgi:putative holliday junction resolvase
MRIMALDVGTKRIGVAMSDELFLTAQGGETIYRTALPADIAKIKKAIDDNMVGELIVGLPINMDGSHGPKAREIDEFIENLAKAITIPIKKWDERLTTMQAERTLLEADVSRAKRKHAIDKLAAQLILQSYLDSRKREGNK